MTAEHLLDNVLLFARTLRASGLTVAANATMDAVRALDVVGVSRREDVHDALRAVLINRQEDLAPFDRLFTRFWRSWATSGGTLPRPLSVPRRATTKIRWTAATGLPAGPADQDFERDAPEVAVRSYSATEVWRTKDFAAYDAGDVARAREAIAQLAWTPGQRVTRRWSPGAGRVIDQRRLVRVNLRHGGEPILLPRRRRRSQPRPLVVLCDVSGSMAPYTHILLLFIHALAHRYASVELFLFSTRLTRVTRHFADRPIDSALAHVRDTARDWSGGTRIGEALRRFHVEWARRVLRRGPAVLLISDGWDLGDPDLLRTEIARLRRGSFRLIWLNPLVGSPGYEPLTRGMRTALPFVDDLLSVRNLVSLESLASHLEALPDRRRRRGTNECERRADTWT